MGRSIFSTEKKGRGRPRTNPVAQHLTMPPELSGALDAYVTAQADPSLSRPEAIRRMLTDHLRDRGFLPKQGEPGK